MTSATERLSALLNERGKAHRAWPSGLVVWHDEGSWVYEYSPAKAEGDYWGGILHATLRHCDPEQAVAATLGPGTCEVEGSIIDTYEYNRWEYDLSCGHTIIWESSEPPNYCPECGRRVVG